ncbi:MAG: glycosyltransferase family 39 protein [Candidatus Harrisonbacteria bacterium]|nr:glycosyltransferase family 39 protein [Candidatus Harrisonbacteria bacterium]
MLNRLATIFRWSLLVAIFLSSALLMLNAARTDSAITDELAHIPAGYSYVKYLDYRLNPEHPPLVKVLAGLPLLSENLSFPTDHAAWQREVNGQWTIGRVFLYESGNDADKIIFWARLGPILLTLLTTLIIYLWSKELLGRWWALLPTFLFALSPTVLAHGHYVTTDLGAAFGFLIGLIAFLKFLHRQTGKNLFLAGIAFGLAQLTKFSVFLLAPLFIFLAAVYYLAELERTRLFSWKRGWRYCRSLLLIFAIGFLLVFLFYLPLVLNYPVQKQIDDTAWNLSSFAPRFMVDFVLWLSGIPVLRAFAEYLLGLLMVSQRTVGGNTAYFFGEVSNQSWWYYFPAVFLVKEPLASLVLILVAFFVGLRNFFMAALRMIFRRGRDFLDYLGTHFAEFSMLSFIILYWAVSMKGNLNIGVRHIIPTLPFIYILAASGIRRWISVKGLDKVRNYVIKIAIVYRELFGLSIKSVVVAVLIISYLIVSLATTPRFLSFFNLGGGGTANGYRIVTDSNYDWGQDLKRLAEYVEQVNSDDDRGNDIEKIAVDYFGGGDPKYYLGELVEPWWSARGNPTLEGVKWLAISINVIQGAKGEAIPALNRKPEDEYRWLENPYQPFARAGTSIFIYKFE